MSKIAIFLTKFAINYLDGKYSAYIYIFFIRLERHARVVWLGSYNGVLVLVAALISAHGWPLIAAAAFASVVAALPISAASFWSAELVGFTRVASAAATIKALGMAILGGFGFWAYIPTIIGNVFEFMALLLITALMVVMPLIFLVIAFTPLTLKMNHH